MRAAGERPCADGAQNRAVHHERWTAADHEAAHVREAQNGAQDC
jgi:hypothetical protein